MKPLTGAFLIMLGLFHPAVQAPVPVTSEPHHHMKFENEYVRVFDVVVPAGQDTLYHVHSNDYAFVNLADVTVKAQVLGGQPTDLTVKNGEARFTKGPITHRVLNPGSKEFRNITIEILKNPGTSADNDSLGKSVNGYSLVLENDRVRIGRVVLEPGESTGLHTHKLMSLGVPVTDARVKYDTPGQKSETMHMRPGQFNWHASPRTHNVTNVGKTRYETVEIEWK